MEFYLLLYYVKIRFKKGEKKVLHKKGRRHLRGKGYNWSVVVFLIQMCSHPAQPDVIFMTITCF